MPFKFAILCLVFAVSLSACGNTASRAGDAAPLSDNVSAGVPVDAPVTNGGESAPQAQPAASETVADVPVLTFIINGGIVGFCDELTLTANGNYLLNTCAQEQSSGTLPQSDRVALKSWVESLGAFQLRAEDNPGAADSLTVDMNFSGSGNAEADNDQKQAMYDWVSGLIVQLRPKPQLEPTPTPQPIVADPEAGGICPDIQRPALIAMDTERPDVINLLDVSSLATCTVSLGRPPFGRILNAGGNFFFPVADQAAQTVTVWQIDTAGTQNPLEFTAVTMEEPRPYGVAVSDDGAKIAWSYTEFDLEAEPPVYRNFLWIANSDGSNLVTILDGVENDEVRVVAPVQFSADGNQLYYALQPDIGPPVFGGRYDNLYRVPVNGGEPELVYACPSEENPVCISGLAADGSAFTILEPSTDSLLVLNSGGETVNTISLPATDYVERTQFAPNGNLAFVSATLSQPADENEFPHPDPGIITVLVAPYTGMPQTVLSDSSVGTLWGWLDDGQLLFGSLDEQGSPGTALVNLDGQVSELAPGMGLGVLR